MTFSADVLLDRYFETAFSAPDGIKRLRELILTLAMQGKLVPQDTNDQPARELLKEIEAEKRALIKAGKIKKQKPLPKITPEEIPYDLPESWEWVKLGDIGTWQSGSTPSRSNSSFYDGDIPWVKSGEVKQGRIFDTEEKITPEALQKCSLNLNPIGSVLIAMYGANIGEVGILEIEATTNQAICACQAFSKIDKIFLTKLLTSLKSNFVSQGAGAAQPNISRIKIINTIIPLPPLAEQKCIVEKCDRLMAQCDKLEQLQKEKEQKRILIHTAAREKLLKASDQETFGQAWDFIKENFGELYAVKENVTSLRQAILQLAVMGKLVSQDPGDSPASELLKDIEAEKQQLIKEGKIKKQKPLPEITANEIPYDLPDSWKWVRLAEMTSALGDGIHGTPQYDHLGNYLFINGNNLINGSIEIKENTKKVNQQEYLKYQKPLNKNTVFVSINGTIGNVAFYNFEKIILGKSVCYFNLLSTIEKQYIKKIIESQYFLDYAFNSATGTTIKNVSLKAMRFFLIPLPPLPEQHRIVAKVDALMALCDRLENQIAQQTAKQTQLLEAVMAGV